ELVARELLDPLGVLGREIRPQLDDDAALGGVDQDRVLGVEAGRQLRLHLGLGERGHGADQCGNDGEDTDHDGSCWIVRYNAQARDLAPRLLASRAATAAGTKAETSPPMPAIWRTKVAVIRRARGEAGTKTLCTSRAPPALIPANLNSETRSLPSRRARNTTPA